MNTDRKTRNWYPNVLQRKIKKGSVVAKRSKILKITKKLIIALCPLKARKRVLPPKGKTKRPDGQPQPEKAQNSDICDFYF